MAAQKITDGLVVTIAYSMTVDGEVIEEAPKDDPLDYLHGAEDILPGLEAALTGKSVGDQFELTLEPEDGFGEYEEDELELLDLDDLPEEIEVGTELWLEDDDGNTFEAVVKEITDEGVVVDMNSPFAGKQLVFSVEVLGMRQADPEELEHGHVHGDHDHDEHAH